jgi:hypothetical protein
MFYLGAVLEVKTRAFIQVPVTYSEISGNFPKVSGCNLR